ncbi:hypothetical protein L873DRAFT_1788985 [Choiromyces venosus 120613-1]|uniref:Uncharacterized protein n=1 Tax=Choiromyces venosus 120613-1 TaxID=1336337 RepID=A0A3N4JW61_9PEZI|nr:hypothetical protein L873DRAFT_1788985 [Choiromyces venosus 120613-1]
MPPIQDIWEASESTSGIVQQPAPPSTPTTATVGTPSWVIVFRKGKMKAPITPKPAPAAEHPSPANAPAPKKDITMRDRRLVIKYDGFPLAPTTMELRDAISSALTSTYI